MSDDFAVPRNEPNPALYRAVLAAPDARAPTGSRRMAILAEPEGATRSSRRGACAGGSPILASCRLEMYDGELSDECAAELLRRNPGRVVIAWSQ